MRHTHKKATIDPHAQLPAEEREIYWKLFSAAYVALGGAREEAAQQKARLDPSKKGEDALFYHQDPIGLACKLLDAQLHPQVVQGIYAAIAPHLLNGK